MHRFGSGSQFAPVFLKPSILNLSIQKLGLAFSLIEDEGRKDEARQQQGCKN